ncbi:MAG TPA: ABC transporter permease, partial [Xanthobacteraceae bacterium]|nr:ABC transporter permease [Xanthobacteraceae bacterium]
MPDAGGLLRYLDGLPRRRPRLLSALLLLPILVLLVVFFVVPLVQLLELSTLAQQPSPQNPHPPHSLANYARFFGDPFYLQLAANSMLVGFATTLATLLVSYPVAFYITRIGGWERTLISVACLLPIFVNVIVGILGWYILLLPYGVIQQILSALNLVSGPLQWLRTFPALVAVLTYEHIPFAVLILVSSLQAIPADKINAARLLGAGAPRIFFTLVLPLTMPGLVASAILIFSLSASSYLTPILIGAQRIRVLPLSIFSYGT